MLNRKTTQKYFRQSATACSSSDPVRFRSKVWLIRPNHQNIQKAKHLRFELRVGSEPRDRLDTHIRSPDGHN